MYKNMMISVLTIAWILTLIGCGHNINKDESLSQEVKEQVTADEFKQFYNMDEGSVSDEFLASFIENRELTEEELSQKNYDVMVKKLYDSDISYDANIYTLISGERVSDMELVEPGNMTHLIMINDLAVDGTDFKTAEYIVLDVEKQKLYVSHEDITSNYESAEKVVEVDEAWIQECVSKVKDILAADSLTYSEGTEVLLDWHLYFIQKDKKVVMHSGKMYATDYMYEWYRALLGNITDN